MGWLSRRSSSTILRALTISGVEVRMIIPSVTGVVQAGIWRPFICSTSTKHIRQAPKGLSFLSWHRIGILIPFSLAASYMVAVLGAVTCLSSIVRLTISTSVSGLDCSFAYAVAEICLFEGHETAGVVAGLALGALFLVKKRKLSLLPDNCINRTGLLAGTALDALILDHLPQE